MDESDQIENLYGQLEEKDKMIESLIKDLEMKDQQIEELEKTIKEKVKFIYIDTTGHKFW